MSSADGFYDSERWMRVRYEALKASDGRCSCCGQRPDDGNPLHVDHVKPRSTHPELALVLSNLQVLCKRCNLGKGAWDETRWGAKPNDPLSLTAWMELPEEHKKVRRELIDRSIRGSTAVERNAARAMLDEIEKYARTAMASRETGTL